jgi:integrase
VGRIVEFERLSGERLDAITGDRIAEYIATRKKAQGKGGTTLQVASLNRELQVLRRIFSLAEEWGRVERALPRVKMIPGERHRERVLSVVEEDFYLKGASTPAMERYADAALLRDVAMILIDCGLRPEECFRLGRENVADGNLEIHYGKTENARRRIPMTTRVAAVLDMRLSGTNSSSWVFPAQTKSGHIEPSSLKKQHRKALAEATRILRAQTGNETAQIAPFELYTLRHTCLTRWAPHMDPWTLAYLAGHRDMNITKRYVHPQEQTVRSAIERVEMEKTGHTSRHTIQTRGLDEAKLPVVTN